MNKGWVCKTCLQQLGLAVKVQKRSFRGTSRQFQAVNSGASSERPLKHIRNIGIIAHIDAVRPVL